MGFRKIVDLIVESKKPVVGSFLLAVPTCSCLQFILSLGHNCLLDLFHLYSRFIGRLPQTIGDWKQSFNSSLNLYGIAIFLIAHLSPQISCCKECSIRS